MALVGRFGLLEYDVPGPRVVHERMIAEHIQDDDYVVITPDEDVYVETMSVLNPDLKSFRVRPRAGALPPGVVAGEVYALPHWGNADLVRLRGLASAEALAEKGRRGLGGGAVVAAHPPIAGPPPVAAVQPEKSDEDPPGAKESHPGVLAWVAAEACGPWKYGDVVVGVVQPAVLGGKVVHVGNDGQTVFCICIKTDDVEAFNGRPSVCDPRIVKVRKNAIGTPERPLSEIVAETREYRVSWTITGPRTSRWCLNYLCIEGLGFEGHHERVRQLCKLDVTTWGVMEHFQLSMMLRQFIQVDMINGFNNLGIELMFRRLQTIEYAHSEKAREAESKAIGGKLSLEEQMTFGSLVRQHGTLMIAPALLDHVKIEVEKEVMLQKNLRKSREERELARKKQGKGKDQENP